MEYQDHETWILSVLYRRGPEIRKSKLLPLLRHLGNAKVVNRELAKLARDGFIQMGIRSWQGQRRIERHLVVRLLPPGRRKVVGLVDEPDIADLIA